MRDYSRVFQLKFEMDLTPNFLCQSGILLINKITRHYTIFRTDNKTFHYFRAENRNRTDNKMQMLYEQFSEWYKKSKVNFSPVSVGNTSDFHQITSARSLHWFSALAICEWQNYLSLWWRSRNINHSKIYFHVQFCFFFTVLIAKDIR